MSTAKGEYITIEIASGTYEEEPNIEYKGSANIHLKGTGSAEYGADVRIIGSGSDMQNESKRSVLEIYKGDWIIENITIEHKDADTKDQAEALGHQSNGTLAVKNCSFISRQDTIRTQGKAWFYKCYIEGDIDFLWMETPGKVALYEECRLRAVTGHEKEGKPVKAAYFAAPRASSELTEVYKGLVIYNCILEVESGLDAYFARNPWNKEEYFSTFYNQVAVVASKVYGEVNSDIWKYKANGTENQQFVGFKTDESFHESSSRTGARLTARQVADEYSGRRGILNRYYDLTNKVFSRDSGSNWDIDAFIEEVKWTVTPDNSKEKLDTDVSYDGANGTYDFKSVSESDIVGGEWSSDDTYVSTSGFVRKGDSHGLCSSASSSITVRLAGISRLGLQLCQYGNNPSCTIKNAETGETLHTIEDMKADSDGETNNFYYTTPEPVTVKIEFAGSGVYIHGISVTNFVEFVPVTGVSVTGDSSVEVAKNVQLTASVEPENATNKAVKWSSSDENIATVDQKGKVSAKGVGKVTIKAVSAEDDILFGTFEIEVKPETATDGKTGVTWDFTTEAVITDGFMKGASSTGFYKLYTTNSSPRNNRGSYQFFPGDKIYIPCVSGDTVTVTGHDATYGKFKLAGEEFAGEKVLTVSGTVSSGLAGDTNTYVVLEATTDQNSYLKKIVVRTSSSGTSDYTPPKVDGANGDYNIASKAPAEATQGTAISNGTWDDGYFAWTGYKYHSTQYGCITSSSNSVSITLAGPSVISITGSQHNNGTMTAKIGDKVIATGSTKTSTDTGLLPFIADGAKGDVVVITFEGTNYLGTFKVRPKQDSDVVEVESITVNDPGAVTLAGTTMSATVKTTMFGSTAVTWSVSDAGTTGATIDAETGVLTVTAAGTAKVKATSVLDPSESAEREVTVTAGAIVAEKNKVYTWNFVGLSSVPTEKTDAEGNGIKVTIGGSPISNSGYGLYNSAATYTFPVAGNATVIAYISYINGNGTLSLKNGVNTVGTDESITKSDKYLFDANDHKPANGPVAYTWYYSGDATDLTLEVSSALYIAQIVVDSTVPAGTKQACTYDFTNNSMKTPFSANSGNNKIHWYGTEAGTYKDGTYGIQAKGSLYLTFYVDAACTVKVNTSYEQATGNMYLAKNETSEQSHTLTGNNSANEYTFDITDSGVYTVAVPKNTYIKTISIE